MKGRCDACEHYEEVIPGADGGGWCYGVVPRSYMQTRTWWEKLWTKNWHRFQYASYWPWVSAYCRCPLFKRKED